jgi:hypothetical protein
VDTSKPLDEQYLAWLYSQVSPIGIGNPTKTHWSLLGQLYRTEFVWWVGNDENRAEDGKELRREFAEVSDIRIEDQEWMELPCSMLELLIGLSRRFSFDGGGEPRDRFWEMMSNLHLQEYTDAVRLPTERVNKILSDVIWRNYRRNGVGGIFPLKHATQDQTGIELIYQMSAYILESQE